MLRTSPSFLCNSLWLSSRQVAGTLFTTRTNKYSRSCEALQSFCWQSRHHYSVISNFERAALCNSFSTKSWRENIHSSSARDAFEGRDLDVYYLRDSCTCPRCINPSTKQKLFETSNLPLNLAIREKRWSNDGNLEISWENDLPGFEDHTSSFSPDSMKVAWGIEARGMTSNNIWTHTAWSMDDIVQNLDLITFTYQDYVNNRKTLKQAVNQLHNFGIVFITSCPLEPDCVRFLAQRIGPLKATFYGETWDVRSRPSAKNVAYTADDLDFHMDLLYMKEPPTVQLLHCLQQSTYGGESRFSDAVRAFNRLQGEYPGLVQPLVQFPITYRYKNDGFWFQKTRRFLEGGTSATVGPGPGQMYCYPVDYDSLNWSPPFQGPFEQAELGSSISFRDYIEAAKAFKQLLAEDSAVFETKLEAGTCVMFNNRRVLHARRPFTSEGGERLLRGAYVDGDYLRDRYRVLNAGVDANALN